MNRVYISENNAAMETPVLNASINLMPEENVRIRRSFTPRNIPINIKANTGNRGYFPNMESCNPNKKRDAFHMMASARINRLYFVSGFNESAIHGNQEFLIAVGSLHLIADKFHGFNSIHISQMISQYPHSLKGFFVNQ